MSIETLAQIESRLKALGFDKIVDNGRRIYQIESDYGTHIFAQFSVSFKKNLYTLHGSVFIKDDAAGPRFDGSMYSKSITICAENFDRWATEISNGVINWYKVSTKDDWVEATSRGFWDKTNGKLTLHLTQKAIGEKVRFYYAHSSVEGSTLHTGIIEDIREIDNKLQYISITDDVDTFIDPETDKVVHHIYVIRPDKFQLVNPVPVIDGGKLAKSPEKKWVKD